MDWLNASDSPVERDVSLADRTWFGLGGRAACMVHPRDEAELVEVVRRAARAGTPVRVLGGGANLLVSDEGVDGVVVVLDAPAFTETTFERAEDAVRVNAGGGADLMKLCVQTVRRGLAGLECMAGIPGTVGGAVRMNAGGRFGAISDALDQVRLLRPTGAVETVSSGQLGFGYRRSNVGSSIVLSAAFTLAEKTRPVVKARYKEYWEYKKQSQPMASSSAGCIFKNPPGESAGRLIDAAGLKGCARGRARVSDRHANFIVADEGATATDVLDLIEEIRRTVLAKFGVDLELEIEVWRPVAEVSFVV